MSPQVDDVPPARARSNRGGSSLSRRRTSLVGRDEDVVAVLDRLREAPAVTLVGVGGVGKTRLAYESAWRIEQSGESEVHLVELASTIDPDAVARVVADSMGLPVTAEVAAEDALVARLSGAGSALLLLDNCEQVIVGASALVDDLLDCCPELTVLATSRIRLGIEGEQVWPVDPLSVGDGSSGEGPAVELLIQRATAAHPNALDGADREDLAALAACLDGLPLALELAAARLGTMSLTELRDQVGDRLTQLESSQRGANERHRSLAAVVEWSYRLLDEDDQRLARSLSVFRGSFTREAALEVTGMADAAFLDRFVETSLLTLAERRTGTRYLMLEMIRQFLADELDESGEAGEVRLAHAEWALDRATLLTVGLRGPDEREAVAEYAAELENLGAALAWSTDQANTELTTGLVRYMYDHVLARGGREVHAWIERATESVWDETAGGDAIITAATASMVRGDIPRYRELLEQADALGVEGEDMPVPTADEWSSLLTFEGRVDEAVAATDQVPLPQRDDLWLDAYVLLRRSMARAYSGRTTEALEMADEAVRLAERSENPTILGWSHYVRGEALMGVDPGRAIDTYNDALRFAESVDNTFLKGLLSVALATALGRHGDPAKALEQFRETITWWQEVGAWSFLSTTLRNFGEFLSEQVDRNEEAVLVRCSVERFDASSAAGGIDAERDRHLRRTLTERLGSDRFNELLDQAGQLDRDEIVRLALDTIDEELAARHQPGQFRVIVFTDLEQSTRFMADRGDSDGRRIMREYSLRVDAALARHNGESIKELGDGVLATFTSVADALRSVVEMMVDFDAAVAKGELPLRFRVGVHAGEPIIEKGDVHGTTVNLAARVVDRAEGGEILVTDTIRQIAIGADYTFTPVGETELKGIPQPIGLHRLEWA